MNKGLESIQNYYSYNKGVYTFTPLCDNSSDKPKLYLSGMYINTIDSYFFSFITENTIAVKQVLIYCDWKSLLYDLKYNNVKFEKAHAEICVLGNQLNKQALNQIRDKYSFYKVKFSIIVDGSFESNILLIQIVNCLIFSDDFDLKIVDDFYVLNKGLAHVKLCSIKDQVTLNIFRKTFSKNIPFKLKRIKYEI